MSHPILEIENIKGPLFRPAGLAGCFPAGESG